jgi:hypothetical protein
MNFDPKIAPLVAEFLAGFTAVFLGYFALPHDTTRLLSENPGILAGAAAIIAWLLGTFVDALRNCAVEPLCDRFPAYKIDWNFLMRAAPDKVASLERYFLSFYTIDVDMALTLLLFITFGPIILCVITGEPVHYYSLGRNLALFVVAAVFALDAYVLRQEIKEFIEKDGN